VSRADADLFGAGGLALALARQAFGGRGCFAAVRRRRDDGSWSGPEGAIALESRRLESVPYACGEPMSVRQQRLDAVRATVALRGTVESTEGREGAEGPSGFDGIRPVPVGEPQGLDTLAFFAACRLACPQAHLVADLEILGLKLGPLCLSFGADEIMGAIVERRELRLGARVGSKELTRDEAAQLLLAAGFAPSERLPDGGVRTL
jgi:hypothetical protein